MNNPTFYLMTPAMSGNVEVIAVCNNHNLNVLLNFRRRCPWVSFLSCTDDEAYMALHDPNNTAIGVGCYVPSDDVYEDRFRRLASKAKAHTFTRIAKGWHDDMPTIALRLAPRIERERKAILRLFN